MGQKEKQSKNLSWGTASGAWRDSGFGPSGRGAWVEGLSSYGLQRVHTVYGTKVPISSSFRRLEARPRVGIRKQQLGLCRVIGLNS